MGQTGKRKLKKKKIGIMPVKINTPAKWLVCGIQTKSENKDLLEAGKLSYLWRKWLTESEAHKSLSL